MEKPIVFKTLLTALLFLIIASGCDNPDPALTGSDRPFDHLLENIDLQTIVELQQKRDGTAIAEWLTLENPAVRARAAFALASVQDSSLVSVLLDCLADTDSSVRSDVAFAIGQSADSTATGALFKALESESDQITRSRLIEAIGKTGGRADLASLAEIDLPGAKIPVYLAIASFGRRGLVQDTATEVLLEGLASDDASERRAAAYFFGRISPDDGWKHLAQYVRMAFDSLAAGDYSRFYLVNGLSKTRDSTDQQRFVAALLDPDFRTRYSAVRAVGSGSLDKDVVAGLFQALRDTSVHVVREAGSQISARDTIPPEWSARILEMVEAEDGSGYRTGPLLPVLAKLERIDVIETWISRVEKQNPSRAVEGLEALAFSSSMDAYRLAERYATNDNAGLAAAALNALVLMFVSDRPPAPAREFANVFFTALHRNVGPLTDAAARGLSAPAMRSFGVRDSLIVALENATVPKDNDVVASLLRSIGKTGLSADLPIIQRYLETPYPQIQTAAAAATEALSGEKVTLPTITAPLEKTIDWNFLRSFGPNPVIELTTEAGVLSLVLNSSEAPLTVQTILELVESGAYDSIPFHRVIANFVTQGGDVSRSAGWGGPGFSIRSEFTRISYVEGTIGMASSGKDTEGSQFFIAHSPQPHLDGRYTAFGLLESNARVLENIYRGSVLIKATVRK